MADPAPRWSLLSNHGHVLFHIAANPDSTLREVSDNIGITERQVTRIVGDLADSGMLRVHREGRRNRYSIDPETHIGHPMLSHIRLDRLLGVLVPALSRMEERAATDARPG